jgi:hypothetical protein
VGESVFGSLQGKKNFLFFTASTPGLGPTQPQGIPRSPSPVVKPLEHEADHSPLSSAEVENAWNYTFILRAWCLINEAQGELRLFYVEEGRKLSGDSEEFTEEPDR